MFLNKNFSVHAIFNDQNLNNTLTDDVVSFSHFGPGDQILGQVW